MDETILIVDDDSKLCTLLGEYLTPFGFVVETRPDALQLRDHAERTGAALIILDVMLPGKDGVEALKELRRETDIPVIMLTARGDETDRIVGLELGADDYLAKPFNPRELLARIKAILRRATAESTSASVDAVTERPPRFIQSGDLRLDRAGRVASVGDNSVELSAAESAILEALMENPNVTLSRDTIMNMTQGRDFMAYERSIDVHVSRIRTKLAALPGAAERIRTVWGTGYVFMGSES